MAKAVKKAGASQTGKPKADTAPRQVAGKGFSKSFSPVELKEIRVKREEMRARLFANG